MRFADTRLQQVKRVISGGICGGSSSRCPWELFHRGFGWLWLLILDLLLIGFFRPGRGYRLFLGRHGICRYRSSLTGSRGKAGIGQGPVLAQPCPAPGAEVRLQRELLPAIMTELGDFRRFFRNRGFMDFFMDLRPPGRFGGSAVSRVSGSTTGRRITCSEMSLFGGRT